jgi:hypothetical protein
VADGRQGRERRRKGSQDPLKRITAAPGHRASAPLINNPDNLGNPVLIIVAMVGWNREA